MARLKRPIKGAEFGSSCARFKGVRARSTIRTYANERERERKWFVANA